MTKAAVSCSPCRQCPWQPVKLWGRTKTSGRGDMWAATPSQQRGGERSRGAAERSPPPDASIIIYISIFVIIYQGLQSINAPNHNKYSLGWQPAQVVSCPKPKPTSQASNLITSCRFASRLDECSQYLLSSNQRADQQLLFLHLHQHQSEQSVLWCHPCDQVSNEWLCEPQWLLVFVPTTQQPPDWSLLINWSGSWDS